MNGAPGPAAVPFGTEPRLRVIEVHDPAWDNAAGGLVGDPHCLRPVLAAARVAGRRPVLVHAEAQGWRGVYPLVWIPTGDGRFLARSPDYGGPWIDAAPAGAGHAATAFRRALDAALPRWGVVSEVCVCSVWLPHRDAVAAAWAARSTRQVVLCAVPAGGPDPATYTLQRRRDLRRAAGHPARVDDLQPSTAPWFAARYEEWMTEIGAPDRFRPGRAFFDALAGAGAPVLLARCLHATGGAAALFLRHRQRASYAYVARWGEPSGAPSAVLHAALRTLARSEPVEVLLGGGRSDDPDDPLLRFKRSWGGRLVPLSVAARVFDPDAHCRLVAEGQARDLPHWAVQP